MILQVTETESAHGADQLNIAIGLDVTSTG